MKINEKEYNLNISVLALQYAAEDGNDLFKLAEAAGDNSDVLGQFNALVGLGYAGLRAWCFVNKLDCPEHDDYVIAVDQNPDYISEIMDAVSNSKLFETLGTVAEPAKN